jgi:MFS family permease
VGWLIAARFIDRIGKGIRGAPRDALIADISPIAIRGASFGLRQSLDTVGAFIGPLLAIVFMWLLANNIRGVFWFAVVPALLSMFLMIYGVADPDRRTEARETRFPLHVNELKRLGLLYWNVVAVAVVFTLARFSEAFLILRAQNVGLDMALVPAVLVLMNVFYALAAYPAGVLSDNGDRTKLLTIGLLLLVAADLILALTSGLIGVAIGVALWGLHMGFSQGLLSALVADVAPAELRGTAYGMLNLLTGVALLAASVIAGILWDATGPQATFLAGAWFAALALVWLLLSRGRLAMYRAS